MFEWWGVRGSNDHLIKSQMLYQLS